MEIRDKLLNEAVGDGRSYWIKRRSSEFCPDQGPTSHGW